MLNKGNKRSFLGVSPWVAAMVAVLFCACARMGSAPTGGPADLAPPMLLDALPQEGFTNFRQKEIVLEFDEYILLQNTDKIVVSPKIDKVSYRHHLKRVYVTIEDTLKPDQTYSINFKDAIVDLHESRPIKDYTYYFSTGSKLDSARLAGRVVDAFSLQAVKEASVMLYAKKPEEYPILTPPDYVAKTDTAGLFALQYIKEGCYFMLAGSDENKNYLIEPTEEKTAFSSDCWQTVSPKTPVHHEKRRGMKESDSAAHAGYMAARKTRWAEDMKEAKEGHTLYLYQDKYLKNLVKGAKWSRKGEIDLAWHYTPDSLRFSFLPPYQQPDTQGFADMKFHYVLQDDLLSGKLYFDNLRVSDLRVVLDYYGYSDTLELRLNASAAAQKDTLKFKVSGKQNSLFFKDSLLLDFSLPLFAHDLKTAQLTRHHTDEEGRKDTAWEDLSKVSISQTRANRLVLRHDWKPGNKYQLFLPSACFRDVFGRNTDTTLISFQCPGLENYGQVMLTMRGLKEGNYELQMVDARKNVIQSLPVPPDGKVEFDYVLPAQVSFVLVEDRNRNHRWDAGDYKQNRLPEKRWFFPKTLRTEADWRIEETWTFTE